MLVLAGPTPLWVWSFWSASERPVPAHSRLLCHNICVNRVNLYIHPNFVIIGMWWSMNTLCGCIMASNVFFVFFIMNELVLHT